jgi:hypothetical protein
VRLRRFGLPEHGGHGNRRPARSRLYAGSWSEWCADPGGRLLTLQDCIELSELTEEEILAIAEHENIPEMVAVELGNYLVHTPSGEKRIKRMIVDDIAHAKETGNLKHAEISLFAFGKALWMASR